MTRLDIINMLIDKYDYKSYLEIGIYDGACFKNIKLGDKDGVDPAPVWFNDNRIHILTSDAYFGHLSVDKKYDIVFIDGLHEYSQTLKDISNSLDHLNKNGIIVLHDCNPPTEWHQREPSEFDGTGKWNGTVWKGFVEYRSKRKDLNMFVVDCDWGVGIIQKGFKQDFLKFVCDDKENILSYAWLDKNRKMALNLISLKNFKEWRTNE